MTPELHANGDTASYGESDMMGDMLPSDSEKRMDVAGIWTGGTIGSQLKMEGGIEYALPGLTGKGFNRVLPKKLRKEGKKIYWHNPDGFPETGIDSTNLTEKQMVAIGRKVHDLITRKPNDPIIIGHGTDTLAYTAQYLSLALPEPGRPVVITGAQIRPDHEFTDARSNISLAMNVCERNIAGISVAFANRVFKGTGVIKNHAVDVEAFASPHQPHIAEQHGTNFIVNDAVEITEVKRPYETNNIPYYEGMDGICRIVHMDPSMNDPETIYGEFGEDADGVILVGYARGNIPESLREALARISEDIAIIVTPGASTGGHKSSLYETSPEVSHPSLIMAQATLPSMAKIKFRWLYNRASELLTHKNDMINWVKNRFSYNFVGEVIGKERVLPAYRKTLLESPRLIDGESFTEILDEKEMFAIRKMIVRERGEALSMPDDVKQQWLQQRLAWEFPIIKTIDNQWFVVDADFDRLLNSPEILPQSKLPHRKNDGKDYVFPDRLQS